MLEYFLLGRKRLVLFREKEIKLKNRWIGLILGIILFTAAYLRGELMDAIVAFFIGSVVGFLLDCFGVGLLKLWYYPKQQFLKANYFGIVVPAWGVFSMLINLTWNWFQITDLIVFVVITAGLIVLYEVPNLKICSWKYTVSMWLVITGWFPLVLCLRTLFLLLA